MRGNPFPGMAPRKRPPNCGYGDTVRTARVWKICNGGSWSNSCGRTIEAGEKYQELRRGGLHTFHVCAGCAGISG